MNRRPRSDATEEAIYDGDDHVPRCPWALSKGGKKIWKKLIPQLDSRILRKVDVHLLQQLCALIADCERLNEMVEDDPTDLKTRRVLLAQLSQVQKLSGMFGLSPRCRSLMKTDTLPSQTGVAAWLERGGLN